MVRERRKKQIYLHWSRSSDFFLIFCLTFCRWLRSPASLFLSLPLSLVAMYARSFSFLFFFLLSFFLSYKFLFGSRETWGKKKRCLGFLIVKLCIFCLIFLMLPCQDSFFEFLLSVYGLSEAFSLWICLFTYISFVGSGFWFYFLLVIFDKRKFPFFWWYFLSFIYKCKSMRLWYLTPTWRQRHFNLLII